MDDIIQISDDQKQQWHLILQERLGDNYDHDIVEKKLRECITGWPRAPKLFEQRIERKFFHKTNPKKEIEQPQSSPLYQNNPLFQHLYPEEVVFFEKRMEEYQKDFEFNESSDKSFLMQLVIEEIMQARCLKDRLDKNMVDHLEMIEEQLNNSMKRMIDLQKNLGITRERRRDEMDSRGGDIATLASTLDQKLKIIKQQENKDEQEELYYMNEKSKRPLNNILPPLESVQGDLERVTEMAIHDLSEPTDVLPVDQETDPEENKEGLPTGAKL